MKQSQLLCMQPGKKAGEKLIKIGVTLALGEAVADSVNKGIQEEQASKAMEKSRQTIDSLHTESRQFREKKANEHDAPGISRTDILSAISNNEDKRKVDSALSGYEEKIRKLEVDYSEKKSDYESIRNSRSGTSRVVAEKIKEFLDEYTSN